MFSTLLRGMVASVTCVVVCASAPSYADEPDHSDVMVEIVVTAKHHPENKPSVEIREDAISKDEVLAELAVRLGDRPQQGS